MNFDAEAEKVRDQIRLNLQGAGWEWVASYIAVALKGAYDNGAADGCTSTYCDTCCHDPCQCEAE